MLTTRCAQSCAATNVFATRSFRRTSIPVSGHLWRARPTARRLPGYGADIDSQAAAAPRQHQATSRLSSQTSRQSSPTPSAPSPRPASSTTTASSTPSTSSSARPASTRPGSPPFPLSRTAATCATYGRPTMLRPTSPSASQTSQTPSPSVARMGHSVTAASCR